MNKRTAFVFFAVLTCFVFTSHAQAKDEPVKVYTLPPKMIAEYIDKTAGQKRVLLIYTSWCGYCRKKMPGIMDIERSKKGSVIAVSVDDDYGAYAKYAKKLSDAPFPLILNKGRQEALIQTLKSYNVKPWNSYPTVVFLNEKGKAVAQGNYSVEQAAKFVFDK